VVELEEGDVEVAKTPVPLLLSSYHDRTCRPFALTYCFVPFLVNVEQICIF